MKQLVLLIALLFSGFGFSQLPIEWMGHYSGELTSYTFKGDSIQYHMEMDIQVKTDTSYSFTIIYGEDSLRQERKYTLINLAPNQFKLDENNSIVLDMSLINGALFSVFEVQGNLLHAVYTLSADGVKFELSCSISGGETGGKPTESGEEIPLVQSYVTGTYQIAHLKKTS